MQEKNLVLSGDIDPSTAIKAGKLLGLNYLLTGAVTEYGARDKLFYYSARVLDRLGRNEEADRYYNRVLSEFPDSEYAKKARGEKPAAAAAAAAPGTATP